MLSFRVQCKKHCRSHLLGLCGVCVEGKVVSNLDYSEVLGTTGRCLRFTLVLYLSAGLAHRAARANQVSLWRPRSLSLKQEAGYWLTFKVFIALQYLPNYNPSKAGCMKFGWMQQSEMLSPELEGCQGEPGGQSRTLWSVKSIEKLNQSMVWFLCWRTNVEIPFNLHIFILYFSFKTLKPTNSRWHFNVLQKNDKQVLRVTP